MSTAEKTHRQLFEKAKADVDRLRKERDAALELLSLDNQRFKEAQEVTTRFCRERDVARGTIRVIGRLSEDPRVVDLCKAAIAGTPVPDDTARIDAIIEAEADIEMTLHDTWRVTAVDEYEDADLRRAIDKLIEGNKGAANA